MVAILYHIATAIVKSCQQFRAKFPRISPEFAPNSALSTRQNQPPTRYNSSMRREIRYIVVHTAADTRDSGTRDTSAADINTWHKERGFKEIGYHFVVRRNGKIEPGRSVSKPGAHTRGLNHCSIGICLSGHGDLAPLTQEQHAALVALITELMHKYSVPAQNVIGHREVNALVQRGVLQERYRVAKTCPGRMVDMDALREELQEA